MCVWHINPQLDDMIDMYQYIMQSNILRRVLYASPLATLGYFQPLVITAVCSYLDQQVATK